MRVSQQTASGLFFILFGAGFLWLGSDLTMGTAADMGPGYVPRWLALGCMGVGIVQLAIGAVGRGLVEAVTFDLKATLIATAMVGGFALALPWLGLPAAVIVSMLPAILSGEKLKIGVLLAIAAGLAAFATILFVWGLKLLIPVWPTIPGLPIRGLF